MTLLRLIAATVVTAFTVAGCSDRQPLAPRPASSAAATGSGGAPAAPSSLSATAPSYNRIDVSWRDNSTDEAGFEVYRSTAGPSGAFSAQATTVVNVTAYGDTGLNANTQYCYEVRSFGRRGSKITYSSFSAVACATTPAPPPPQPVAPSNLGAGLVPGITVHLQWSDNSTNESGFRLERSADAGTKWQSIATLGPSSDYWVSYIDSTWTIEQSACYRVFAFNGAGDSPASNISCTVGLLGPTDLIVTDSTLSWTDNSGVEDGYEVWMINVYPDATLIATLPPNSTSFPLGIRDCGGYCRGYQVAAFKTGVGYSDWAAVCLFTCSPADVIKTSSRH